MGFCATGVLMAVKSLHQSAAASILGLRTLNPYVATAVSGWDKVNAPKTLLPRELGANAARQRDSLQAAGASSFGMSGVNAHVLVTNAVFGAPVHESTAKQWRRSRSVALQVSKIPLPSRLCVYCQSVISDQRLACSPAIVRSHAVQIDPSIFFPVVL